MFSLRVVMKKICSTPADAQYQKDVHNEL